MLTRNGKTSADAARQPFAGLRSDDIDYAGDPARSQYRGFAALHDLFDANDLLPCDGIPDNTEDEAFVNGLCTFANEVVEHVTALIIADWQYTHRDV